MILIRQISWLKAARRDFEDFPDEVQRDAAQALSIAARGGKADTAKPFKGVDGGVFEIALQNHPRTDEKLSHDSRFRAILTVLFLCSDGARWINGANLPVDGGLEASINAAVLGF